MPSALHSKAAWVKSGSSTGVFQSLWNSQWVQGNPSKSQAPLCSNNSNTSFRMAGSCRDSPVFCVLVYSGALWLLLSLWLVWVLLSVFKEACGLVFPQRLCFELRGLPPLSLIIAFGSVPWQEMRDLFYLAWTTLFLPDYWCYFTLNNMTLCSQSAQGQSLRVIDTFKSRGGDYNQREGVCEERI